MNRECLPLSANHLRVARAPKILAAPAVAKMWSGSWRGCVWRYDVSDTLDPALATFGGDKIKVEQRPRPLSANAPNGGARDPCEWPEKYKID